VSSEYSNWWSLEAETTFLNHGSFGACPTEILDYQVEIQREMEAQPVRFFMTVGPRIDAAREALASFVGADASNLAFVTNATTGVNAVLRSLSMSPGDEILVTDHEYNACRNAVDFIARRDGLGVVVAEVPFPISDPEEAVRAIVDRATDRTALALVDHITSSTGLVLPIERIVSELADRGIDTLVDGAHAPGQLDLNLESLGAAYYTGNCHKWMCTPKGSALLYVRSDRRDRIRPLTISHGANYPTSPDRDRFRVEFDWTGTDDPSALLCIPATIAFFDERVQGGWNAVRDYNRQLALAARLILCGALGVEKPAPDEMIGNLASIPLPASPWPAPASPTALDPLHQHLLDAHAIESPVVYWPRPPKRLLRVSAQLYNDEAQYRHLAKAVVTSLADEGRRGATGS